MKDREKDEKPKKGQVIVASKALLAKKGVGMTLQEQCEFDHVGRCGACDKEGVFTPCA